MTDRHLDGNGMAALLEEIVGAEATTALRDCQSCGVTRALGSHRAYRGAGIVLRCPHCGDLALCVGLVGGSMTVRWYGTLHLDRAAAG